MNLIVFFWANAAMTHWPLLAAKQVIACKICAGNSLVWDECDVNQGGSPELARRPDIGQSLTYHRCTQCGFVFTAQLDGWFAQDFAKFIYNDEYIQVDPDYVQVRPASQAQMLLGLIENPHPDFCLLDYGAGSGTLARMLREAGLCADSEDPYSMSNQQSDKRHTHYDIVCAFEVLEHSPNPLFTLGAMRQRLKPAGIMIISTLLQPSDIDQQRCQWWYCMPRNGHISLFSALSLQLALKHIGAKSVQSHSAGLHIARF